LDCRARELNPPVFQHIELRCRRGPQHHPLSGIARFDVPERIAEHIFGTLALMAAFARGRRRAGGCEGSTQG
jgi:hypothetical protein